MCFSLEWLRDLLIWIIVVCGVVALVRLLISFVLPHLGLTADVLSFVARALYIIMWMVICIAAVVFIFGLISCFAPSMPRLR
jgi:hypothetical protein